MGSHRIAASKELVVLNDSEMDVRDIANKWSTRKLLLLLHILLCINQSSGGNILLVTSNVIGSPSHYMALSAVTGGLVSKGHNVTIVTNNIKGTKAFSNDTFNQALIFRASYKQEDADQLESVVRHTSLHGSGFIQMWKFFFTIMHARFTSCLDLWNDDNALNQLKTVHFDFVLVSPFSSCDVLVAHYLQVPFAVVFSSIRLPSFNEGHIGMPYPSSYVPFDVFGRFTDDMTFLQRVQNFASSLLYSGVQYIADMPYRQIQVEHTISPDKSIAELFSNASLFLAHVSLASDFPRPYTPNYIPIGGLLSRPSKPLPMVSM